MLPQFFSTFPGVPDPWLLVASVSSPLPERCYMEKCSPRTLGKTTKSTFMLLFPLKVIMSAGTSKHNLNPSVSNKSQESIKPRVFHISKYLLSFEPIITYFIIIWSQMRIHNSHPEELTIQI